MNVPPVMKIASAARARPSARPSARLPPRMTPAIPASRKGNSRSSMKTAAKQADIPEETDDEEGVTDEMLDGAYTR